ncbi:MAG: dihydropteroate synthase [Sphingobacteriaceae bacterium]|nr:dihydropteroate synthase [Sphingobacteriaceae bacterium]
MAIINLTPDSFYDGNKYFETSDVMRDIEEKLAQGADIIDLGAMSSRPGSSEITLEEEWNRLTGTLKQCRKEFPDTFISIDTYRSEIAKRAAEFGADIINDIGGGNLDSKMHQTISEIQIPYILMHMQGNPKIMQENPTYQNVTTEVKDFFKNSIAKFEALNFNKIIIDPGFGFGKTLEHNYTLLKNLEEYTSLGFPVLAGVSRKSMINKIIQTNPVSALNGTTVLNTIALLNGAKILRVHDVLEAKQAIELVYYFKNV